MTTTHFKPLIIRFGLTAAAMLFATAVSATHVEMSRLASQLSFASGQLANELRYTRGFGTVQRRADQLRRETEQLLDALRQNRSDSYVRSKFNDVRRHYESLEEAFLRASRTYNNRYAYNKILHISDLYSSLSSEYYFTAGIERGRVQPYYYNPPVVIQRHRVPLPNTFRNERRLPDYRAPRPDYRRPPNRHQENNGRHNRQTRVPRINDYDHRSEVLERRERLRGNDSTVNRHDRSSRNRRIETRRPNHYD